MPSYYVRVCHASVSTGTAKKSVAQSFMKQMGGGASLITLHCRSASDISQLSFYPHEAECLLPPGTKLEVLRRERIGAVTEIEVREVAELQ